MGRDLDPQFRRHLRRRLGPSLTAQTGQQGETAMTTQVQRRNLGPTRLAGWLDSVRVRLQYWQQTVQMTTVTEFRWSI